MNIFYLHKDPVVAASIQTNKHVVKMIIESAQLMSTAHRILDREYAVNGLYKTTHINHPCAIWTRTTTDNYRWLYDHFVALCNEYTSRYKRIHLTETKLKQILSKFPDNLPVGCFVEPPLAMSEEFKTGNSITSYRLYYTNKKLHLEEDITRYNKILHSETSSL